MLGWDTIFSTYTEQQPGRNKVFLPEEIGILGEDI
jgi:hypothetical protein